MTTEQLDPMARLLIAHGRCSALMDQWEHVGIVERRALWLARLLMLAHVVVCVFAGVVLVRASEPIVVGLFGYVCSWSFAFIFATSERRWAAYHAAARRLAAEFADLNASIRALSNPDTEAQNGTALHRHE